MSLILSAVEAAAQPVLAIMAAIAVLIPASVGAVVMSLAISKTLDAIARQPEAESKLRTTLILGLVFIETTIIYALIVAIMIVIQLF